ncbi:MAG: M42 family metallopeptidase [Bdellovibrionales bacterium]|nr:M42 family metallopeptidase [Bdellovibrionales bacterium]
MNQESKNFLYKLLKTPSPTGFEVPIQKVVRARMEQYADTITSDVHGNLIVGINTKAKKKVMLAGHCDQIGFMVRHIDSQGYIYVDPLGGIDATVTPGTLVTIHTSKGSIPGVFGRKPIHLQEAEERTRPKFELKSMWIDIGAKDQKEAQKLVEIGCPATYALQITELQHDLIAGPGLDDKVGLFIVMETLRLCARGKLNVALYAVSTVQEEVGLRGAQTAAYGIDPDVGIAVDVTFASDNPGADSTKSSPCKLGSGPGIYSGPNINPRVEELLKKVAKEKRIPFQPLPSSRLLGNDARAMQSTRAGVAAGSIGVPNRYMHTAVETCSLKDLENSAKLLAEFVKSLTERTNFIPK